MDTESRPGPDFFQPWWKDVNDDRTAIDGRREAFEDVKVLGTGLTDFEVTYRRPPL